MGGGGDVRGGMQDAATSFDGGIPLSLKSPKCRHPSKIRDNILCLITNMRS